MCELFAMSSGQHYTAQEYLPLFADKSRLGKILLLAGGDLVLTEDLEP